MAEKQIQNRVLIRDIKQRDFSNLEKYFGEHKIYKKPKNHWENYLNEHAKGNRIVKSVELNDEVIGFGTLKFKSDYAHFQKNNIPEINDILIAPDFRKLGFGRALVEALEYAAKEIGFAKIGLAVGLYSDYGPAQRLYIKMNYVPDGLGITYHNKMVIPGESYPVDDDLLLWLIKPL